MVMQITTVLLILLYGIVSLDIFVNDFHKIDSLAQGFLNCNLVHVIFKVRLKPDKHKRQPSIW